MKQPKTRERKSIRMIFFPVLLIILLTVLLFGRSPFEKRQNSPELNLETQTSVSEVEEDDESQDVEELEIDVERVEEKITETPADSDGILNIENGMIETPYFNIFYPEELSEFLVVQETRAIPYTLAFYAVLVDRADQRLFDLYLGEGANGNLGTAETAEGTIPVGMTIYSFEPDESWSDAEISTVQAMQDVANDIIDQLPLTDAPISADAPVVTDVSAEQELVLYMKIETPHCVLLYPATWSEYLQITHESGDVHKTHFYGKLEDRDPQLLFSIFLGGDEGEQVGVVTNEHSQTVTINIVMAELPDLDWSAEEFETLCAMQDAVNELIGKLPLV